MSKELTVAQREKLAQKEAKELAKRRKQSNVKVGKYYLFVLILVMTLAYLVDEMSTNITLAVQSNVIYELFNVPTLAGGGFDTSSSAFLGGVQSFNTLTMIFMIFVFIMPFYKSLADKYGRRFLLVINTTVMGIGMLALMLAPNWTVFAICYMLLNFVVPADIHSLYFMETAPPKHRVKISLGAKAIAILGISSIGLLRLWFLNSEVTSWRSVYMIPVIIALIVAFIVLCFIKETPQFVSDRISYLEKTPEQRAMEAAEHSAEAKKVGVLPAFKFVFKHRQLRWIAISTILFGLGGAISTYYNTIMATNGMTEKQISLVVICYPFAYSFMTFMGGLISDKWGRKVMVCAYGILAIAGMLGFCTTSSIMDNGLVTGMCYGLFVAGWWGVFDAMAYVTTQESSPTYLRASIMGVVMLMVMPGTLISLVLWGILISIIPMGTAAVVIVLLALVPCLVVFMTKVSETFKVDLNTVRGDEWDKVKEVK